MKVQINDWEFVNKVSYFCLSPPGKWSCGMPRNRTVKDSLVKVLDERAEEWPDVIDCVLFAHRVSRHYSTKYSPFYLMYNRHPTLPIDVKYNLDDPLEIYNNNDDLFDEVTFQAVLSTSLSIKEYVYKVAHANIKKAQLKQQHDYNRRKVSPTRPNIGDKVLVQNQKRQDGK